MDYTQGGWEKQMFAFDLILDPIAGEFGFEQAPDAHRMLAERRNVGKVGLTS